MMFASFVVSLQPQEPASLSGNLGASLHGLFFNLVAQQDGALAERLHADAQSKPFTVSPLRGRMQHQNGRQIALPTNTYWVRYTTLSDELFAALNAILVGKYLYREQVTLCGQSFQVTDVQVEPREDETWACLSSAEELWTRASPAPEITLRFASPTTFKQRGLNLLFPIPANVFHSYREKWNAFTLLPIDDAFIPWVEQNVVVEAHHLQTRSVELGDGSLRGFTGWVRYGAVDKDPTRLKQLNALADFAFFCGTGQKTTQGMGQTRRIKAEGGRRKDEG